MQVSIIRRTGFPVELNDVKLYKDEFRVLFDRAENILKREALKLGNRIPDQLKMQARIAKIQNALTKKYPTVQEVVLPADAESWISLQNKFGNILVTKHRDKDEVILVIEDMEDMSY